MSAAIPSLQYLPGDKWFPIHDAVQKVTAVPFVQIAPGKHVHLEGLNFDRQGDMYCVDIYESILYKIKKESKEVSVFYEFEEKRFSPTAVKFHKDGRIFVAGVDMKSRPLGEHGGIAVISPDGKEMEFILTGWNIDDLVFDSQGGFYFTNYIGTPWHPDGTIEYIAPDMKTRTTVMTGLASPNGVALSPDEELLWVTETAAGVLHRLVLKSRGHDTTPYKFEGFYGPDSCSVDEDGNLYVAMSRQGRIMVFNSNGFLIGQVLTPGRERGISLGTTHAMVDPFDDKLYFVAHDINFDAGANIFYAGAFAKGNRNAFQYQ